MSLKIIITIRESENEGRNVDAVIRVQQNEYIVLKGRRLALVLTPSCPEDIKKQRKQAKELGEKGTLKEDKSFNSPSGAARFVLFASANGKREWKNKLGEPFEKMLQEKVGVL